MHTVEIVQNILQKHNSEPNALIQILNDIQEEEGYLPRDSIDAISAGLNLPLSKIYGVITFYEHFKLIKPGKHTITVCMGTACFVKGAKQLIQTIENTLNIQMGETTEDGKFSAQRVACLGCCALAPVVRIDGEVHGQMNPAKLQRVLNKIIKEEETEGEGDE